LEVLCFAFGAMRFHEISCRQTLYGHRGSRDECESRGWYTARQPPSERKQLIRRSSLTPEAERKLVQRALAREREIFARRVAPLLKRLDELDRMKRGPDLRLVTSAPRHLMVHAETNEFRLITRLAPAQACHHLGSTGDGLSAAEAERRLAKYGPNLVTRERKPSVAQELWNRRRIRSTRCC
jgi:Cation transporter/ATPase, N-terminus